MRKLVDFGTITVGLALCVGLTVASYKAAEAIIEPNDQKKLSDMMEYASEQEVECSWVLLKGKWEPFNCKFKRGD